MGLLGNGATLDTLLRRVWYGGRKGRRAVQRLLRVRLTHPSGGLITFKRFGGGLVGSFGRQVGMSTSFALATMSEPAAGQVSGSTPKEGT